METSVLVNPIGKLQELCTSKHWCYPVYKVLSSEGPPHRMVFTVSCQLYEFTKTGTGLSKAEAKSCAASNMYLFVKGNDIINAQLNEFRIASRNDAESSSSDNNSVDSGGGSMVLSNSGMTNPRFRSLMLDNSTVDYTKLTTNPVGFLQELCASIQWPLPMYAFTEVLSNHKFLAVCQILEYEESGSGINKKEAKKEAASRMGKKLLSMFKKNVVSPYVRETTGIEDNETPLIKNQNSTATRKMPTTSTGIVASSSSVKKEAVQDKLYEHEVDSSEIKQFRTASQNDAETSSSDNNSVDSGGGSMVVGNSGMTNRRFRSPMLDNSTVDYTKLTTNPVGFLQELCASSQWPLPVYAFTEVLSNHSFLAVCQILEYEESGSGTNKKEAKKEAASRMGKKLLSVFKKNVDSPDVRETTGIEDNETPLIKNQNSTATRKMPTTSTGIVTSSISVKKEVVQNKLYEDEDDISEIKQVYYDGLFQCDVLSDHSIKDSKSPQADKEKKSNDNVSCSNSVPKIEIMQLTKRTVEHNDNTLNIKTKKWSGETESGLFFPKENWDLSDSSE